MIQRAILDRPRITLRKNQDWLIGNVERISKDQIFFAFGKITKSISEKYDEETKSFANVRVEQAPYTYVAVDLVNQVCAIAVKVKISAHASILANRLVRVLNSSRTAIDNNVEFVLPKLKSPGDLLKVLQKSQRVRKLEITFSPPNPWDVDKDFHKPQEEYLKQIGGKRGKTIVSGDNLDKKVIAKTVKSIAATGNEASISAKMASGKAFKTTRLGGDPVTFSVPEAPGPLSNSTKLMIFDSMSDNYGIIRGTRLESQLRRLSKPRQRDPK